MSTLASILHYLVIAAMLATLGVLLFGVFSMVRGGSFNAKYSNKLMRMRVGLQALALSLFALLLLLAKQMGGNPPAH